MRYLRPTHILHASKVKVLTSLVAAIPIHESWRQVRRACVQEKPYSGLRLTFLHEHATLLASLDHFPVMLPGADAQVDARMFRQPTVCTRSFVYAGDIWWWQRPVAQPRQAHRKASHSRFLPRNKNPSAAFHDGNTMPQTATAEAVG
jgi:hypothetical protein